MQDRRGSQIGPTRLRRGFFPGKVMHKDEDKYC